MFTLQDIQKMFIEMGITPSKSDKLYIQKDWNKLIVKISGEEEQYCTEYNNKTIIEEKNNVQLASDIR